MFLQLIDTHLLPTYNLHKIFNRNTVKVSYSCTQNISQIIKRHNRKVTQNDTISESVTVALKSNVHLMAIVVKKT